MKVLHIITSLGNGGAEGALFRLAKVLKGRGVEQVIVSMTDYGVYGQRLCDLDIEVHCLNMPRGRIHISGFLELCRLVKKCDPVIVQTWMYHADLLGGVVCKLLGVGRVFWGIRNLSLDKDVTSRLTRLVALTCAFLSRFIPEKIISCSHLAMLAHENFGYAKGKITVIPNGFFLNDFSRASNLGIEFRSMIDFPSGYNFIGFVARFDPMKDHANLFGALVELKERSWKIKCILVGSGMDCSNSELMGLVKKFGLEDVLILYGPHEKIPMVMNALDIHVLSSRGEAFPNVVAEAMACGTPCVVTDVGDAAFIVGGVGVVVPPKNSLALANAIENLLFEKANNSVAWEKRREGGRSRIVEAFSMEKMADSFLEVWK